MEPSLFGCQSTWTFGGLFVAINISFVFSVKILERRSVNEGEGKKKPLLAIEKNNLYTFLR